MHNPKMWDTFRMWLVLSLVALAAAMAVVWQVRWSGLLLGGLFAAAVVIGAVWKRKACSAPEPGGRKFPKRFWGAVVREAPLVLAFQLLVVITLFLLDGTVPYVVIGTVVSIGTVIVLALLHALRI